MAVSAPLEVLFSIHDVMPETLGHVATLLELFRANELAAPALLVVPGRAWTPKALEQLRVYSKAGCELIAHGWLHHAEPKTFYHRLHAILLSRNVAEHLARDELGVQELILRSVSWFAEHGLPTPKTYIPPAWALGMPVARLESLPLDLIETVRGVHVRFAAGFRLRPMPLLGFEADTVMRARSLRFWNSLQFAQCRMFGAPLRISIHPRDDQLLLAGDLRNVLQQSWRPLSYASLLKH
jgi:predicted deacetylase